MYAKHLARTVALCCIIIPALMGYAGAPGSTPLVARAAAINPVLHVTVLQPAPLSLDVAGTGFTPGGRVHIDLLITDVWTGDAWPTEPTVSADLTASRTSYVSTGHSVFVRQGGYVDTLMTIDFTNTDTLNYYVAATDNATGVTSTYCYGPQVCYRPR